jgi:hypothetical protein
MPGEPMDEVGKRHANERHRNESPTALLENQAKVPDAAFVIEATTMCCVPMTRNCL